MKKELSENAIAVYKKLYLSKVLNEKTPTEVHRRVAEFAAQAELPEQRRNYAKAFFDMMENNQFRPNTPTMINAGVTLNPQTSACFVGDLQDDMDSILDFDREAAMIYKQGSGIGGNYGTLREKNAPLSTGGASSGPAQFLRKGSATAHAVKSGGSSRRAAHMAMMFDTHPDLMEFIKLKAESDEFVVLPSGEKTPLFSTMNLSVAISDAFMQAVKENKDWNLIGIVDGQIKKTIPAREIFKTICHYAWKSGDPGVWFIDKSNATNTLPSIGRIISTNPCGEQALHPRQACGLGAINIAAFVNEAGEFDWDGFTRIVCTATRFLDNCIDLSGFPTPAYDKMAKDSRPLGLGIMGFADALISMGIRYDSADAYALAQGISLCMTKAAILTSITLAKQKGPFPLCVLKQNKAAVIDVVKKFNIDGQPIEDIEKYGIRNSHWTTIAPTGTTSISCDCSQGMEPLFAICYDKIISDSNEVWTFVNPIFESRFSKCSWYREYIKKIAENHGSLKGLDLPTEADIFVTAHDIHWKDRIRMQAALQKGISNSISSTINLPNSAAAEEISKIYFSAWENGLKGITVYRDGSLDIQPVNFGKVKDQKTPPKSIEMPKIRSGRTHEVNTGHGKVYFTINCDESGHPLEIFTNGGKNGSVNAANLEAMGRLASIALQEGVKPERLAKTIENINDGTVAWDKIGANDQRPQCISSIPDAMGKILRQWYCTNGNKPTHHETTTRRCEDCNSPMYMHDGCLFCPQCGSKCG